MGDPPKYYVYISDAKLDMLAEQVPKSFLQRLTGDLKVDVAVMSVSLAHEPTERTRVGKLRVLERYLEDSDVVGSPDAPKAYVAGTMDMRWGPYVRNVLRKMPPTGLYFFGGRTESTYVGLGGSSHHVLAGPGNESAPSAWSASPQLYAALTADLSREPTREIFDPASWTDIEPVDWTALLATRRAITSMHGPKQRLQFLAKRLLYGQFEGDQILLGSPIYVAQVD